MHGRLDIIRFSENGIYKNTGYIGEHIVTIYCSGLSVNYENRKGINRLRKT